MSLTLTVTENVTNLNLTATYEGVSVTVQPTVTIDAQNGGGGDMLMSVYDTNLNGIVDNAELVNGLTVETAVPIGAVFTDTVYDDTAIQEAVALNTAKVGLTSNSVGLNELKTELKSVHTIVSNIIDWNAGVAGLRTFTGTPVVVFTETNVPSSTVNKTITIEMTGAVTSIAFPANYKKAVNTSETYDGTKRNVYVFDYVNGTVYYSNTLFQL